MAHVLRADALFTLDAFPAAGLPQLRPSFARLPFDPYISRRFRQRRLSRFDGPPSHLRHLRHSVFAQSQAVNQLLGGVVREYEELEDELIAQPGFRAMIASFVAHVGLPPSTVLGVHQIRILCSGTLAGDPAPEGIHQDGFDAIGIFCISRVNVVGANTHLYRSPSGQPVFSRELQPGEVLYVDDRELYHYTDPLHPRVEGDGHRDVFVITA